MSSFALKLIAVVSMLTDHMGAVLFPQYIWMRYIGRLAFPIYCFLLTEGYLHTHSFKKYILRMTIFMVLSEIPFDLAFSHTWLNIHYQNVYWTLLLGLLAIRAMEWLQARLPRQWFALGYVPVAAAAAIAWFIHTDYNAYGVLMIFGFYIFKKQKVALAVYEIILFGFLGQIELFAAFAFIPIFLYNGKKGLSNRWLNIGFYAFYPIHLIVLVLIRYLCG